MKINCEVKKDKRDEKLRSKKDDNCELNGVSKQIFEIIREKPNIFASVIKNKLSNISSRTIDNYLRQLKDLGLIAYKGSPKTGGYYVV
jgi:ATP-dependent DNA helicase RecG